MEHVEYLKGALGPYADTLAHSPSMLLAFAVGLMSCIGIILGINYGSE